MRARSHGVYAYASESLRIGVQEGFKELDNGQNMTVTSVSKKLCTMAQVEETMVSLSLLKSLGVILATIVTRVVFAEKTV